MSGTSIDSPDAPAAEPSHGQYKGSVAFSHMVPGDNESVNPNTASLNYTSPLLNLRGKRPSVDLKLSMIYSLGAGGTFAIPPSWSLDLPYVTVKEGPKSVTTHEGRTYSVNFKWEDSKNHKSGLRYMNHHGVKFQQMIPAVNLPFSVGGTYSFRLDQADGSTYYFDGGGKPVMYQDIYGNFILYKYQGNNDGADVHHPTKAQLKEIQDSWGQQVKFNYYDAPERKLDVTLPDGGLIEVSFSSDGIEAITDPLGHQTKLSYSTSNGSRVLSKIVYPTGLVSEYGYTGVEYLDADGKGRYLAAVENAIQYDSLGKKVSHTTYKLGAFKKGDRSPATFTGAKIGVRMGAAGEEDLLIEGGSQAIRNYTYDVLQTSYDEEGAIITKTETDFNNYHLPIIQTRHARNELGEFVATYQTRYNYEISVTQDKRTPAFTQPTEIEEFHAVSTSGDTIKWEPLTRTTAKHNEFGNLTEWEEELQDAERGYVKQISITNGWVTVENNIQVMTKSTRTDWVAGTVDETSSELTEDRRDISSTTTFFSLVGQQPGKWTRRDFAYDLCGRNSSERLSWAEGVPAPQGSLNSVKNEITYSFNEVEGILTQTAYDADANATVLTYNMRKENGPLLSKTLPYKEKEEMYTERFEYDEIGRQKSHIDALGNVTETKYIVGPNGGSEIVTSPLGYVKRTNFDVLVREVEMLDNGDPTNSEEKEATRVLSSTTYDLGSRIKTSTDKFGLKTEFTYDALDRTLTIRDPLGNEVSHEYDDVNLTITQKINGDARTLTQLDGRKDELQVTQYSDSGDKSNTYHLIDYTTYDGSKRVLCKWTSQVPKVEGEPSVVLEKESIEYGPDSIVQSHTITGRRTAGGEDILTRRYTLDLLGNVYTWVKECKYSGMNAGVLKHQGPIHIYDSGNRLEKVVNQLGQQETSVYNERGWISQLTQNDGSVVKFECNAAGQFTKEIYQSSTIEYKYNADGRLRKIVESDNEGSRTLIYESSIDGTLTRVLHPDGKSIQKYVLDKYSRVEEEHDIFGVCRKTVFKPTGEIDTRKCFKPTEGNDTQSFVEDTVKYNYGTVNHTYGQSIGYSVTGRRAHHVTLQYDGFYRLRKSTTFDGPTESVVLLENEHEIDGTGKLTSAKTRSHKSPNLDCNRTMEYDGLGQLVTDRRSSGGPAETLYTYDGNFNVKTKTVNGLETCLCYNELDQRIDQGFEYDKNGRMIKDNQENRYTFDDRDRLTSVLTKEGEESKFKYHADGYLASRSVDTDTLSLFHSGGKLNALTKTARGQDSKDGIHTSIFWGAGSTTASYPVGATDDQRNASYWFSSLGSNVLAMGQVQDQVHFSASYDAYGSPTTAPQSSSQPSSSEVPSNFRFTQEFTDTTSGVVYLRSRFYNPKHMAFLSMDRNHQENRYTYCDGDPINRVDPLGLSWKSFWNGVKSVWKGFKELWNESKKWIGIVVGGIAAVAVTALTAGLAAPLIGAVASGIVGGIIGGISGGLANNLITWTKPNWKDILIDGIVGGIGGGLGSLLSSPSKMAAKETLKYVAKKSVSSGFKTLASSLVENPTRALLRYALHGEPISFTQMAIDLGIGVAVGGLLGYTGSKLSGQAQKFSTRKLASARQHLSRIAARRQPASELNMMLASPAELTAFRSRSSTKSSHSEVSDLASSTMVRHIGTLDRDSGTNIDYGFPLQITGL